MQLSSTCCCTRPSTLRFHRRRRQETTCRCAAIPHIAVLLRCDPSHRLCTHRLEDLLWGIPSSLHPSLCSFNVGHTVVSASSRCVSSIWAPVVHTAGLWLRGCVEGIWSSRAARCSAFVCARVRVPLRRLFLLSAVQGLLCGIPISLCTRFLFAYYASTHLHTRRTRTTHDVFAGLWRSSGISLRRVYCQGGSCRSSQSSQSRTERWPRAFCAAKSLRHVSR
jgi:hypothetical protein